MPYRNRRLRSSFAGGSTGDGGRDVSPDFIICRFESSIERCSSASDVLDHESILSDVSLHSSTERCSDPDPKRNSRVSNNGGPYLLWQKVDKAEAIKQHIDVKTDEENQTLCSARSSVSYKECKNQQSRTEILLRKSDRRRPASLDLKNHVLNIVSSSPRLGPAMKTSGSAQRRGSFPSPGTPNHQKGWSSERVPLHTNTKRIPLMPYNNRKTLPSKWEDAERWIVSPVAGENALEPSSQQPNRPKSKSGPLGPHGPACYSMCSPAVPNSGNVNSFVTESPFLTGVSTDYNTLLQYQSGNISSHMDHCIARSVSIHGCSELLSHSLQITEDDKIDGSTDAATDISYDVSRRDMATQMSPESSPCSSLRKTSSRSISAVDLQHAHSSKSDIRDVLVDDQVTLTPYTKKSRGQISSRRSNIVDEWKKEGIKMTKSLSKVQTQEAKIAAWENLQKAKADAAIRKLEMKLEKKRSSSMDRIIHKLQSAHQKAEQMRESVLSNQPQRVAKSSHNSISLIKTRHVCFLTGCFTSPAF